MISLLSLSCVQPFEQWRNVHTPSFKAEDFIQHATDPNTQQTKKKKLDKKLPSLAKGYIDYKSAEVSHGSVIG